MRPMPVGWEIVPLREIGDLRYGKGLPISNLRPSGYPVFGANGVIGYTDEFMYDEEQLLISCRGANSGTINLSLRTSFVTNNSLILEFPKCLNNSKHYFRFALLSRDRGQMVTGSAQPQVTIANAENFVISLAPLPEQRRIVAKIDSLSAKSARARDHLDHVPRLVEKYKQAILDVVYAPLLERSFLENLVDAERGIPYGIVLTGIQYENGIATIRCGDIKQFNVSQQLKLVDPEIEAVYARTRLRGGEVIIAIRGSIGECCVVPAAMKGFNISREVAMIPIKSVINPKFVMYFLATSDAKSYIIGNTKGVAQQGINLRDLRELPTPILDKGGQTEIVRRIETAFTWIDRLAAEATSARKLVDRLDAAVLAKAFRGELVPQDPTDEPASVLLERIRAERAAAPAKRRGRKPRVSGA